MLHDFLTEQRDTILSIVKDRAAETQDGKAVSKSMDDGWGLFYDELTELMKADKPFSFHKEAGQHTEGAEKHGDEYFRLGYSLSEVVHSYGIVCQSITSHATTESFEITSREFQQLNLSLDTAIAEAVTSYEKIRMADEESNEDQGLGYLASQLRHYIENISLTLDILKSGAVGPNSSTTSVLETNLQRMTKMIDSQLTLARLRSEPQVSLRRTAVFDLMHDVGVTARIEAGSRNITVLMQALPTIQIDVDRQLFVAALANLVDNALQCSKQGATIRVHAHEVGERVLIEVEDECGGLADGMVHAILAGEVDPEEGMVESVGKETPRGVAKSGRGLSISRQAVMQNNGELRVEDAPGKGCTFIIDLPKPADR